MKLAEALLLRADRNGTLEQLKQRTQVSARYQEGEEPPEDARELVSSSSSTVDAIDTSSRASSGGFSPSWYRALTWVRCFELLQGPVSVGTQ